MKCRIIAMVIMFILLLINVSCTARGWPTSEMMSSSDVSSVVSSTLSSSINVVASNSGAAAAPPSAIPAPAASDIQGLQLLLGTGMTSMPGRLGSCPWTLVVEHRLYGIVSIDISTWASSQPQMQQIGMYEQEGPVFSGGGSQVYLQNTWDTWDEGAYGKYIPYTYLCDDVISEGERQWVLTSPSDNSVARFHYIIGENSSAPTSGDGLGKCLFMWLWNFSDYEVGIEGRLDNPLGTLPSGGVLYALKGVNPSGALCLSVGKEWYLIIGTAWYNAYLRSIGLDDLISSASEIQFFCEPH